jgi:hypothetical protein
MLNFLSRPLIALLALVLAGHAHATARLQISETANDSVQVALPDCGVSYVQPLNSEMQEEAVYLKAARMGGGVYLHLPYFMPAAACKDVVFEVSARRILWDGKWHAGSVSIPAAAARDKSIFFTNEAAPLIDGSRYFDAAIPAPTLAKLDPAFASIIGFYETVLHADPMRGIGVVAALARNKGNYSGFGGDSLNIIRMSYDNPTPQNLLTLEEVFPSTFAHELSHKLQSEKLFAQPLARHIVEGSADFLKIVVLRNAGLIDEAQAKARVRKAIAECGKFAGPLTLREKTRERAVKFREPYDCGMAYYFTSYYASGLDGAAYVATLRKALSGEKNYGNEGALCLYFEASCSNPRLNGIIDSEAPFRVQAAWLETQLASRALPAL